MSAIASEVTGEELRTLATASGSRPVLSLYLRTDPRDPANTADPPAWLIAARNGLRDAAAQVEDDGDRDVRLAFREAREQLERELEGLQPAQRGRSLVWFVALDRRLDRRFTLQLPVRASLVRLDERPLIAPLTEVVARGRRTGLLLVAGDRIRSLEWAHGRVDEAGDEEFVADAEDWRPFEGPGATGSGRQTATHVEHFEARLEEQRDRFFAASARASAERVEQRGWERVVIAAEGQLGVRFHARLPEPTAGRVVADVDLNLVNASPLDIAERLEPHLELAGHSEAVTLAESLPRRAAAGEPVATGPGAVLAALAERRVEHLVLDPFHQPASTPLSPSARELLDDAPPALMGERAVEAALTAGATVTALEFTASPALEQADGMLAGLRW